MFGKQREILREKRIRKRGRGNTKEEGRERGR